MNAKRLAQILDEEFQRDSWGDLDPWLFKIVAGSQDAEEEEEENANALREVMERVASRINETC